MMTVETHQIHKRKSSKDADENIAIIASKAPGISVSPPMNGQASFGDGVASPRTRTMSTPHSVGHGRSASTTNGKPPSAGPARATFQRPPGFPPISPLRTSFQMPPPGHVRTRSTSTPFTPLSPSPLATSFATQPPLPMPPNSPRLATSHSAPDSSLSPEQSKQPSRRHARIHSRNLSVFFPRPGSIPATSISEDGSQEVEAPVDEEAPLIPSAGSNVSMPNSRRVKAPITPLGQGFTFGARPPSSLPSNELLAGPRSSSSTTARRGHHHKHSLSHQFFSFLEPGSTRLDDPSDLHTQPTPSPISPWGPASSLPDSTKPTQASFQAAPGISHSQPNPEADTSEISSSALATSVGQFVLGSWMWVMGQQVGSLSCTGLGYWVVFDAFGVALSQVVPGWLASRSNSSIGALEMQKLRRPYGNGRVETLLMFAQAVYLMFASVYVFKESVEHVLLSAGGGEGHHHHPGDEDDGVGINFPIFMTFITSLTLFGTAYVFENNTKMVKITGNWIPPPTSLLRSIWSPSRHSHDPSPTTPLAFILSNPFVATPILVCISVLSVALFIPLPQHRRADLVLACIIAIVTFRVAYRASVVLGTVLLQTSPPRGLPSGRMEAFLRAMREVERHPHILHLPAPHIWQLTPSHGGQVTPSKGSFDNSLVVTLEVHVREDLPDDDVLQLTKWTWEKCVHALGSTKDVRSDGEDGGPEITVGVVRG